jgi:deazaflavin-dependent oxidoreductase (nitroreductase family)
MAGINDFNQKIMEEFHANAGKVGGPFAGVDILILTSTGRKSGQMRWHPVAYSTDGDRYIIVASRGGAPTSPGWYHNLVANPSAVIEVGSDVIAVEATIASGAERERLYAQHAARMPAFNEYKTKTTREIPVVVLTRKS